MRRKYYIEIFQIISLRPKHQPTFPLSDFESAFNVPSNSIQLLYVDFTEQLRASSFLKVEFGRTRVGQPQALTNFRFKAHRRSCSWNAPGHFASFWNGEALSRHSFNKLRFSWSLGGLIKRGFVFYQHRHFYLVFECLVQIDEEFCEVDLMHLGKNIHHDNTCWSML